MGPARMAMLLLSFLQLSIIASITGVSDVSVHSHKFWRRDPLQEDFGRASGSRKGSIELAGWLLAARCAVGPLRSWRWTGSWLADLLYLIYRFDDMYILFFSILVSTATF